MIKLLFSMVSLVFAAQAFAGATIEGVIKFPAPTVSAPPAKNRYQIKTSGPVPEPEPPQAVIYLEGSFAEVVREEPKKAQMRQLRFQFMPGVLPVQKGTLIEFPNDDDDYHNVFSYSKAKRFDLGRYRKTEKPAAQLFDKTGVVKLYCEIHEHMRATILVLDTPFFAKANAKGEFSLPNVPPGTYKLKAWLDEKTTLEREVTLKEGEVIQVEFTQ